MIDGEYSVSWWNRYAYASNNPVLYKGPTGHCGWAIPALLQGIVASGGIASCAPVGKLDENTTDALARKITSAGENLNNDLKKGGEVF